MVHRQLRLVIMTLIIITLSYGAVPAGRSLAAPQIEPPIGLVGQEGGSSYAVVVQGGHAYVGIGPRLAVLDVSVPTAPSLTGQSVPLPALVQGLAISSNYVYVANRESGLYVIDVTDPTAPELKGSLDTPGWAQNVAASGTYAYLADGSGGLRIVQASDPMVPIEVAVVPATALAGEARGVAVLGNTACVGAGAGGLVTVDVSDPSAPQIMGNYPDLVATNVVISGTTAYVVDSRDLKVLAVDVSNPSSPQLVDSTVLTGIPNDLAVIGSYLYVTVGEAGLDIFLLDPATGEIVSYQATQDTPGVAYDVAAAGLHAYVADGRSGLRIVDVLTALGSPVEVGFYQTLGEALGLDVSGHHAYVAAEENGLSVMDLADVTNPVHIGSVDTPGDAQSVVAGATRATIADGHGGLVVVDITNPANPLLLGQQNLPASGYAWDIAVQGNYAYVAAESEGMQVIDVSNPASPSIVGAFKPTGGDEVWDVAIEGDYAYLAAGYGGVRVVNISNPASPQEVAAIPTGDYAWTLTVAGGYLYIADIDAGLRIVNVAAPTSPVLVAAYTGSLGAVVGVTVSGRHALVTTDDAVHILDVENPASPMLRASYETAGTPQGVAVGDAVLVADLDGGLRVLDPVDVAVSAVNWPAHPSSGVPFAVSITVANYGPSRAAGVQLADTLPAGMAFVDASPGCTHESGVVTCAIGALASGATGTVSITVVSSDPGVFPHTMVVSSGATEIYEQNNTAVRAIVVGGYAAFLPLVAK